MNNEGIRTIEVEDIRSPDARYREEDITSFVNTTPRMKGPTVTSFQHTSLEDEASHRFRNIISDDRSKSEENSGDLDGSAFLSESSGKVTNNQY